MSEFINIAIDGPVASGKGVVTKGLAKRLHIPALDTGAIYRAVTLYLTQQRIDLADEKTILLSLNKIQMQVYATDNLTRVFVNGHDVTPQLRDNAISIATPRVAAYPGVRDFVNHKIGEVATQGNFILEGRDIGTAVLPHAKYKFYLTASLVERAKRRQKDLAAKGENVPLVEVMAQVKERDQADMSRQVAPLRQAPDAILIDNTNLTLEQTIDTMAEYIKL